MMIIIIIIMKIILFHDVNSQIQDLIYITLFEELCKTLTEKKRGAIIMGTVALCAYLDGYGNKSPPEKAYK